MLATGATQSEIAQALGCSQATISKELSRNSKVVCKHKKRKVYDAYTSHQKAEARKRRFSYVRKFDLSMQMLVYDKLTREQWSPCEIVGYAQICDIKMVSVERIYQYIRANKEAGGCLYKHCRHRLKHRKRCVGGDVSKIPNRKSIHQRPLEVESRERFGDWEMDLIQGSNNTFILVLVERQTRYLEMCRLDSGKHSLGVVQAAKDMLMPYKEEVKTITTDNGLEFAKHEHLSQALDTDVYFTDPYSSWQKGTVENTNKLIRQYIPKRTNFNTLSDKYIQQVENKINNRPRKILNFQKPADVFFKHFYNFGG
jgi:IS30 family transposase